MLPNTILNNFVMQRGEKLLQNSWRKKAFYTYSTRICFHVTRNIAMIRLRAHLAKRGPVAEAVGDTMKISVVAPYYLSFKASINLMLVLH